MGKLDVLDEMVVERWVGELEDWLGHIVAGGFNWDIIVLLEVDTGLLLGWVVSYAEELSLQTWVGWSSNVLPVSPLSVTSTTSRRRRRSTARAWVAICVSIEGRVLSNSIPAWACCGSGTVAARSEVGSAGPVSTTTGASVTCREAVSVWGSTLAYY